MAEPDALHPLGIEVLLAALDAIQDHVAIGEAVRRDGDIVDFRLLYLNAASVDGAGRRREDLEGALVCEVYPNWRESGMHDRFRAVVETGEPYVEDRLEYHDVAPDGTEIRGWWSLSVAPFDDDSYIASSRDVSSIVRDEEARRAEAAEAERNRLAVTLLQAAALPTELPLVPGLRLAARYRPAGSDQPVGGDWYDALDLGGGRVGLVIADVAGHGPEAAAFMVQVRNVVRTLALEHDDPAAVLARANAVVARLDAAGLFATCSYLVVDVPRQRCRWALAGHPPPVRVAAGGSAVAGEILTAPPGPPLGVDGSAAYTAGEAELAPGDLVVLVTDGLVEDRSRPLEAALRDLADDLARMLADRAPCDLERLADAMLGRTGDRHHDDAALVLACLEGGR